MQTTLILSLIVGSARMVTQLQYNLISERGQQVKNTFFSRVQNIKDK